MSNVELIQAAPGNYATGQTPAEVIRCYFHRTAVRGDTPVSEADFFKGHVLQASAYVFIGLDGSLVESTTAQEVEYAVNDLTENWRSKSLEFCGPNGSPLTPAQIKTAALFIKEDPELSKLPLHRLLVSEIPAGIVKGFGNHLDVTNAYSIAGGHVDAIAESEIQQIFTLLR